MSLNGGKIEQTAQVFNKYKENGAYHWNELEMHVKRYNAALAARYNISENIIVRNCCSPPSIIVDIGCGDGVFTKRLAEIFKNSTVIGFDFDETAIRLANEKKNKLSLTNLSFIKGNAFEHINKADLIVATDVIEHLHKPDEFMKNCFSTLNNKGNLFLSTPIRFRESPTDQYHVHEFFFKELDDFSKLFGFLAIEHLQSHDYTHNEKYNKRNRLLGIGKERYYLKYFYNFMAIYFSRNIFENQDSKLPIMQYLLLKKAIVP